MNGIHDLGGHDGYGPIMVEENEPIFHAEWERAVLAMFPQAFAAGYFNLDEFRHGIEKMAPVDYLTHPYYAHWVHTMEELILRDASISADELSARTTYYRENPDAPLPATVNPGLVELVETIVKAGGPARRDRAEPPRFAIGDQVIVKSDSPYGHTRRAGYIRGRRGTIVLFHGSYIYPDSAAMGRGEDPHYVYTVRFTSTELYGDETGDPAAVMNIDVWEPYIDPVAS